MGTQPTLVAASPWRLSQGDPGFRRGRAVADGKSVQSAACSDRHSRGLTPYAALNTRLKWGALANPHR